MSAQLTEFLQTGEDSAVYVNTGTSETPVWSELDLVENVSLNTDHDTKEVKPRRCTRGGVKANLIGLNDFSGSLTSYVPVAGATGSMVLAYSALKSAAMARTPVDLLFVNGGTAASTTDIEATRAVCGVGRNREESGDDPTQETYNFHFVPNDLQDFPEQGTVNTGVFTADA